MTNIYIQKQEDDYIVVKEEMIIARTKDGGDAIQSAINIADSDDVIYPQCEIEIKSFTTIEGKGSERTKFSCLPLIPKREYGFVHNTSFKSIHIGCDKE